MGDSNMRIRQMDGLRAVAALAVVMIHVSAGLMNPVGVSCNQTARFAVPLFIMLSGYGHMHSWLQHSGQSAVQTAKRRLKRVLSGRSFTLRWMPCSANRMHIRSKTF